ncbi:MAG: DUF2513 domain-containing protein [Bacilli bacterium]
MKRDLETIKKILLAVEESDNVVQKIEGLSGKEFAFHASLLVDAGFVHGKIPPGSGGIPDAAAITSLSWNGCEFLDNARNEVVWQKAKEFMKKAGGTASIEILKFALDFFMKQYLV